MRKNSVSEFELEKQDFKIRLKRGGNGAAVVVAPEEAASGPYLQAAAPAALQGVGSPQVFAPPSNEVEIKSPMIGTFYRSPSPESTPYIEVGSEVSPETVVCI